MTDYASPDSTKAQSAFAPARLGPQRRGELALFLTAAVWGTSFIGVQHVMGKIGPTVMMTARFLIATVVLLPAVHWSRLDARVWRQGAWLGLCLYFGFGLQTLALMYTSAAHAAFGTALVTIIVPSLSFVIWRHRWPGGNYLALLASLWGTAWLMGFEPTGNMAIGDALSIVCAFAFAVHIMLLNRFSRQSELLPLLVIQLAAACALSAATWAWRREPWPQIDVAHWQMLGVTLYLGIFTTALCELGQVYGQARTSSTRVAFILALEPVFAAAFAYVLQGQQLSGAEWAGGSLIVGAALVADRNTPRWLNRLLGRAAPQTYVD